MMCNIGKYKENMKLGSVSNVKDPNFYCETSQNPVGSMKKVYGRKV